MAMYNQVIKWDNKHADAYYHKGTFYNIILLGLILT